MTAPITQPEIAGPLQIEILTKMWDSPPGTPWTVAAMHTELNQDRPHQLAYTTVLTVLRNLARRGFVEQKNNGKRAHDFLVKMKRTAYEKSVLTFMCATLFKGNVSHFTTAVAALSDDKNNGG